ncbi:MAG: Clp protease ClpC, partial [Marinilabiliales bacterium]
MEAKFSKRVKDVLSYSREEAVRLGNNYIGLEHLLLGIIREGNGMAVQLLKFFGVEIEKCKKEIEESVKNPKGNSISSENIPLVKQAEKALKLTYLEARVFNSELIGTEHLLLAILKDDNNIATSKLNSMGVDYTNFKQELSSIKKEKDEYPDLIQPSSSTQDPEEEESMPPQGGGSFGRSQKQAGATKSKTPVLDNFGRDLTKFAEEGRLDPIVGREKELQRIAQVLSRRKKNNPILIGEPGVGKSAIAEGLALRIIERKVSRALFNKRIITLDLASLVAGTKYRGQFEERMKAVLNELTKNEDIILF